MAHPAAATPPPNPEELDWLKFRDAYKDVDDAYRTETFTEKLVRKTSANPFVPIGCLATLACLSAGLVAYRRGERRTSQLMMRARVLAQGFTIAALVAGITMAASGQAKPK